MVHCRTLLAFLMGTSVLGALRAEGGRSGRIVTVRFESQVLGRPCSFVVVKPTDVARARGAALIFLHGRGRNCWTLVKRKASETALLSAPFYAVLPNGDDGWYINSPTLTHDRYGDYLQEVIDYAGARFHLSDERQRRAIGGWSMGGYGAVRFAESHPREFAAVASVIGLLDFPRSETLPQGQNYKVPVRRFGKDLAVWHKFNPRYHLGELKGARVLMITGSVSFDHTMNENFWRAAKADGINAHLVVLKGGHKLDLVERALPQVLNFVGQEICGKKQD